MSLKAKALIGACVLALFTGTAAADSDSGFYIGGGGSARDRDGGPRYTRGRDVTVDKLGGPYRTVMEGVRAAGWGGTVHVRPGTYIESLEIRHPVTIVGDVKDASAIGVDPTNLPLIQTPDNDKPCARVDVGNSFVSFNQVYLRASTRNVQHSCIELESGFLSVKDSAIAAPPYVSVVLARHGHLAIENTSIFGGREGVLITSSKSSDTFFIVHNQITQNITGVKVDGLAQVNISANHIFKNSGDGVIYFAGRGAVVGNEIYENGRAGIVIQDNSQRPTVKANKITRNAGPGVEIVPSSVPVTSIAGRLLPISKGEFCDNLISDNVGARIESKVSGVALDCKDTTSAKDRNREDDKRRGGLFGGGHSHH